MIEAAKIILVGFLGIKDSTVLHVFQRGTDEIRKFGFLAGVHMITNHHIMHVSSLMALTDHAVLPLAKVLLQEMGISAPLNFPFLLGILAIQVRP